MVQLSSIRMEIVPFQLNFHAEVNPMLWHWRAYSFSSLFTLDTLNHKKTTNALVPHIFYVAKKWQKI